MESPCWTCKTTIHALPMPDAYLQQRKPHAAPAAFRLGETYDCFVAGTGKCQPCTVGEEAHIPRTTGEMGPGHGATIGDSSHGTSSAPPQLTPSDDTVVNTSPTGTALIRSAPHQRQRRSSPQMPLLMPDGEYLLLSPTRGGELQNDQSETNSS